MPLSPITIRRITLDTKRVLDLAPTECLFWVPHESDLTQGHAIVCGCEGPPYHGGAFAFEVTFPDTYPFKPPTFNFITQDGKTRFNPNLYQTGKVCLSILNTWAGEQWSSVQTLEAILRCIQTTVLNENPLMNEPSHPASTNPKHADIHVYNRLVFHATLEIAILNMLTAPPDYIVPVYEHIRAWVTKHKPCIVKILHALATVYDGQCELFPHYTRMQTSAYKFGELMNELNAII